MTENERTLIKVLIATTREIKPNSVKHSQQVGKLQWDARKALEEDNLGLLAETTHKLFHLQLQEGV